MCKPLLLSVFFLIFAKFLSHMTILIKKAKIISGDSPFHLQVKDISIQDGVITAIEDEITSAYDELIDVDGLHVSLGWMDVFASFADPGYEYRETMESGAAAAAAGGFTDVMLLPNTLPSTSTKAQVEYLVNKGKSLPINIYPIGSVSKNIEGKELAEMYDMAASGAIAFGDGTNSLKDAGMMVKALQYNIPTQKTVIQLPAANSFNGHGLMNEGIASTRFGLPGMPAIAEELTTTRDIELAKYSGGKLHITGVSTANGLKAIIEAKENGANVTCSITAQQLWFTDEDLASYDCNYKLMPPLRTSADRNFIKQAFADGQIDCLASHHLPLHDDEKNCEFEYAKFGNTGLETLFPAMNALGFNLELIIQKLTVAPRKIFNVDMPSLAVGANACLTVFSPGEEFIYTKELAQSQSLNSAFLNKKLKGKVKAIINKNQLVKS